MSFVCSFDGVVKRRKRYPTAVVELDTSYYREQPKCCAWRHLCRTIIGNIPGARGVESISEIRQIQTAKLTSVNTTQGRKVDQSEYKLQIGQQQIDTNSHLTKTETTEISAAVQTRIMVAKENTAKTTKD